jgi:hypothetical protein
MYTEKAAIYKTEQEMWTSVRILPLYTLSVSEWSVTKFDRRALIKKDLDLALRSGLFEKP